MRAFRPRRLIWLSAVAMMLAGLSGAVGVICQPLAQSAGRRPGTERPGLPGVGCLGRVDVEGGLLELAPVRSGRVVAASVREGEAVSAGTVLLQLDEQPARLRSRHRHSAPASACHCVPHSSAR